MPTTTDYDAAVQALRELETLANALRRRIDSHPNLDADRPRQVSMVQNLGDLTLLVAKALQCIDVLPDDAARDAVATAAEKETA